MSSIRRTIPAVLTALTALEAHVYSLNLLNHHEIVNDSIDGHPFAATW